MIQNFNNSPQWRKFLPLKTENHSLIFQHFETTSKQNFSISIVKTNVIQLIDAANAIRLIRKTLILSYPSIYLYEMESIVRAIRMLNKKTFEF